MAGSGTAALAGTARAAAGAAESTALAATGIGAGCGERAGMDIAATAELVTGAGTNCAATNPTTTPSAMPSTAAAASRRGDSRRVTTICVSVTAARAWSAVTVWVPAA